MCYSIEPRERRYVKGYGFMSFARNFNDKYGKSLRDASKTFANTAGMQVKHLLTLQVKKYLKKQQKQLEI